MPVRFTRYLRPNRRKSDQYINLEPEVEAKAKLITDAGYVFEIEVLRDEITVSATIADPSKDEDVAHVICKNGPDVPVKIREMIMSFKI